MEPTSDVDVMIEDDATDDVFAAEVRAALNTAIKAVERKLALFTEPSDIAAMRVVRIAELRERAAELRARAADIDADIARLSKVDRAGSARTEVVKAGLQKKLDKYRARLAGLQ